MTNASRIGMIINLARFHPDISGQVVTYINLIINT
jgi:hypothetical protein